MTGEGPSPRDARAAVLHGEYMHVFGGYDSKRYLNDFHRFHFETLTWSAVAYAGVAPSPRGGHTAVVHSACMFVFGGCDGWNYFNDLYSFSFPGREWAPVRVTGTAPGARSAPATVVHAEQGVMYVFGGYDGARSLNDLFRFDFGSSEWAQVRVNGSPPSPRGGHTAVVHGDTMYTFGGKSGRSPFNDLCAFHFERGEWSTSPSARRSRRGGARVRRVGAVLFIIGGYDGRRYFDDCFEYCFQPPESQSVLSLAGDLESMVNSPQFSDIAFVVDGRTVHAHKFILFARCSTSAACSPRAQGGGAADRSGRLARRLPLRALVLYTGKAGELSPETALDVLGATSGIGADAIARGLCVDNVAYVLQAADAYAALQLRSRCVDFMVDNFAAVVAPTPSPTSSSRTRPLVLRFLEGERPVDGRRAARARPEVVGLRAVGAPISVVVCGMGSRHHSCLN